MRVGPGARPADPSGTRALAHALFTAGTGFRASAHNKDGRRRKSASFSHLGDTYEGAHDCDRKENPPLPESLILQYSRNSLFAFFLALSRFSYLK